MRGELMFKIRKPYIYNIGDDIIDEKRNLTIIEQSHNVHGKSYKYKCNICGFDDKYILEKNLINGVVCSCCKGLSVIIGFNDLASKCPWVVPLIKGGYDEAVKYTKYSKKKVQVVCDLCGKEKYVFVINLVKTRSVGCTCGDGKSYYEKFLNNLLEQLEVEFEWEYSPEWLRGYNGSKRKALFDFYIPKYNLIIEMDGGLGHGKIMLDKKRSIEDSLKKDQWKDSQAKLNGLTVIRIACDVYYNLDGLKNNITHSLNGVFNLNSINWNKCDKAGLKNIIKKVCDYYNKFDGLVIRKEIAKEFNIHPETVSRYLKKGSLHGWCNYNANKAKNIRMCAGEKNSRAREIAVFKDGKFLNIHMSIKDLMATSNFLYNTKFHSSAIHSVLRKEKASYKGFSFFYATEIPKIAEGA